MSRKPAIRAQVQRLLAVQQKVRQLVANHHGLAGTFRREFKAFKVLCHKHAAAGANSPCGAPTPWSNDWQDLQRFSRPNLLTICLYRLGGLADAGSLDPIVPMPPTAPVIDLKDERRWAALGRFIPDQVAWEVRLPLMTGDTNRRRGALDPSRFPPALAQQMLQFVRRWLVREAVPRSAGRENEGGKHDRPRYTQTQLLVKTKQQNRCAVSPTTFSRLRKAACIKRHGVKGQTYGPAEILAMLEVAPKETPQIAEVLTQAWMPLCGL